MGQRDGIFIRWTSVTDHGFSWVNAYVACECTTADDTPLLKYSILKEVEEFPRENK